MGRERGRDALAPAVDKAATLLKSDYNELHGQSVVFEMTVYTMETGLIYCEISYNV